MKTRALIVTLAGVLVVASLTVLGQQTDKSTKDATEAKANSEIENQKFINEAKAKISANQKKIDELRARKVALKKVVNDRYQKRVATLEQKNQELRKKIDASVANKPSRWTQFKEEFNHDMSELAHAIKDIGHNNVK